MKDCNKQIWEELHNYLNRCGKDYVEVLVRYLDEDNHRHQIIQYYNANNQWFGRCGNIFDFDFFDIYEVEMVMDMGQISLDVTPVPVSSPVEEDEEDVYYDKLEKIEANEVQKGDYVGVECERLYANTSYLKVIDIGVMYDPQAGTPIKTVTTEDEDVWSTFDGSCISNPNSFYEVVGYYKLLK